MTTITADIKEKDIDNYSIVENIQFEYLTEKFIEAFPFKLYQSRMMGGHMITMQIPLSRFLLYKEFGMVK